MESVKVPAEDGISHTTTDNAGKPTVQEVTGRPEWLPENFDSVEKFVESYQELRADHTRKSQELAGFKKGGEEAPEDKPEGETENKESKETKDGGQLPGVSDDFATEVSQYAWENGELTEDHYKTLEEAGYSRAIVDQYMEGQLNAARGGQEALLNAGGGQEAVQQMFDWASANLDEATVESYNAKFAAGGTDALMAMDSLKARYSDSGVAPGGDRVTGANAPSTETSNFQSVDQVRQAMADPRYKTDPAYRNEVARKLSRSNVL